MLNIKSAFYPLCQPHQFRAGWIVMPMAYRASENYIDKEACPFCDGPLTTSACPPEGRITRTVSLAPNYEYEFAQWPTGVVRPLHCGECEMMFTTPTA